MTHLYHYCAQSETVENHPTGAQLPAIEEWWDWNSGQTGELVIRSGALKSVITCYNAWTSMDLMNQFPAGSDGFVEANDCRLTAVALDGCEGLKYLDLRNNLLDQDDIDAVLAEAASWGTYGGHLDVSGNAPPSDEGLYWLQALRERNWIVVTDAS
jgi:hypothetical protein